MKVQETIDAASNNNVAANETRAVVNTFYYEARQRQIPLEQLSGNPFIYVPVGFLKSGLAFGQPDGNAAQAGRPTPQDTPPPVGALKLQSVLMGEGGARAMISNNMVAEGQTINGWTVKSIQSREVILTWKDRKHVMTMPR